tara:strand:+ start:971 stop:1855 length:885 start_codon:yes stop_codon:yes gene_type:complete
MALSTIGTAAIDNDAITSAKLDTNIAVDGSITAGTSINAGSELIGNVSGRILLDASAADTDVGDEFLLNATDGSASNDGSKILFEEGTDDPNTVLNSSDLGISGTTQFINKTTFDTAPAGVGMELLGSFTISSAVATFDISHVYINAKFDRYFIQGTIVPANDGVYLWFRPIEDGAVLAADGNEIMSTENDVMSGTGSDNDNAEGEVAANYYTVGSSAGEALSFTTWMHNTQQTVDSPFKMYGFVASESTGANFDGSIFGGGHTVAARNQINGMRIMFSGGNIESGNIQIFGVK